MISRTWHGIVPKTKRDGFEIYLNQTGVEDAVKIKGNLGAYIKIVDQDEFSHFFLCTIWSSWEDINFYAGEKPDIAITYQEDEKFKLISDPIVIHQEISSSDNPFIIKF